MHTLSSAASNAWMIIQSRPDLKFSIPPLVVVLKDLLKYCFILSYAKCSNNNVVKTVPLDYILNLSQASIYCLISRRCKKDWFLLSHAEGHGELLGLCAPKMEVRRWTSPVSINLPATGPVEATHPPWLLRVFLLLTPIKLSVL